MDKKFDIIFSKTECPSSDILLKYAKKELSKEKVHAVEAHLTECEMCNDEIEGYSILENKQELTFIVSRLDTKIDARIKKTLGISLRIKKTLAAAASIILILGAAFMTNQYLNNDYKTMSDNFSPSQIEESSNSVLESDNNQEQPAFSADSINLKEKSKGDNLVTSSENKKQVVTKNEKEEGEEILVEEETLITETQHNAVDTAISYAIADEMIVVENKKTQDKTLTKEEDEIILANSGNNDQAFETSDREAEKQKRVLFSNRKKGDVARTQQPAVNVEASNNAAGQNSNAMVARMLYNNALKLYNEKKYTQAIQKFDDLIVLESSYTEKAEWYKALSLIELDKKEDAIIILNKIIEKKGAFSQKAIIKLSEISK